MTLAPIKSIGAIGAIANGAIGDSAILAIDDIANGATTIGANIFYWRQRHWVPLSTSPMVPTMAPFEWCHWQSSEPFALLAPMTKLSVDATGANNFTKLFHSIAHISCH